VHRPREKSSHNNGAGINPGLSGINPYSHIFLMKETGDFDRVSFMTSSLR